MGFKFKNRSIKLKIQGKEYTVVQGDAKAADALNAVKLKISKMTPEKLSKSKQANLEVSIALRETIAAYLGQSAADEIFKDRPHNVIQEIELLKYIYEETQAQKSEDSIQDLLSELNVG